MTLTDIILRPLPLPLPPSPDLPAHGDLHEVLPVSYTIHNKSMLVEEFEAKMGASDAFMYSGRRLVSGAGGPSGNFNSSIYNN